MGGGSARPSPLGGMPAAGCARRRVRPPPAARPSLSAGIVSTAAVHGLAHGPRCTREPVHTLASPKHRPRSGPAGLQGTQAPGVWHASLASESDPSPSHSPERPRQPRFPQAARLASTAARVSVHARACVRLCLLFTSHPPLRKNGGVTLHSIRRSSNVTLPCLLPIFVSPACGLFTFSECSSKINQDLAQDLATMPPACILPLTAPQLGCPARRLILM